MPLALTIRNEKWHVTGTVIGPDGCKVRVRKSTGFPRHQKRFASEVLSRVLHDAMAGKMSKDSSELTLQDAARMFLTRPNPPGLTEEVIMKGLVESLGEVALCDLTVATIQRYVTGRGNKASTVAREINSIKAMLAHAKAMGVPTPDLELVRPSVDDSRLRWLTEEERDHLIASCSESIRSIVTMLFFSGCRIGEALSLDWRDVRDGSANFTTYKGKSKRRRVRAVPLVPEVLDVLGEREVGRVFKRPDGSAWDYDSFYNIWSRAIETSGIEDFRPHDARHTFASHLVQKGASLRAVADLLGHTSMAMVMRYSHLAPSHLANTIELLRRDGTFLTHE
jgi:integrase